MLGIDSTLFLLIPSDVKERVLHPGKVVGRDGEMAIVEFQEALAPAAGSDVNMYGELRGKFSQQGAVVVGIEQSTTCIIRLQPVGKPISAENRMMFRVSTVNSGIRAGVAREKNCLVADISPEGLAVLTTTRHAIGSVVDLHLSHDGQTLSGKARVQTLKVLDNGKNRYGLLLNDVKSPLCKALQKLSMELQRAQLRRLAGAA